MRFIRFPGFPHSSHTWCCYILEYIELEDAIKFIFRTLTHLVLLYTRRCDKVCFPHSHTPGCYILEDAIPLGFSALSHTWCCYILEDAIPRVLRTLTHLVLLYTRTDSLGFSALSTREARGPLRRHPESLCAGSGGRGMRARTTPRGRRPGGEAETWRRGRRATRGLISTRGLCGGCSRTTPARRG